MPNPKIKRITLPTGSVYDIVDEAAWLAIEELQQMISQVMHYRGRTTTEIHDGDTTSPIIIDGESYTPQNGDVVTYRPDQDTDTDTDTEYHTELEFAWTGTHWTEYGSSGALKALAFKDTASTVVNDYVYDSSSTFTGTTSSLDVTPEGSVSAPTISIKTSGATTTIKNPTKQTVTTSLATAAPGASAPSNPIVYYSVQNETLNLYQIGYNTGDSITTEDVTVKSGDAEYESSQPTFTGTTSSVSYTPEGSVTTTLIKGDKTITVS